MQGFNMGRYVPPDLEGTLSANQASGKGHALGKRARKAGQGILTVRFEMPFAVWCEHCPKPTLIGQGVRFNAEKKRAGSYLSTPIWAFRMKHVDCGGWIEIRTDPKNTEYVVAEGGRRRDTGDARLEDGDMKFLTEEERQRLRDDAFAALEVKIDDRKAATADRDRIEELYDANDRDWSDPFAMNKKLRKTFRVERKELERKAAATDALKDKMSLGIDLLEENDEDRRKAAQATFGDEAEPDDQAVISRAQNRHLFSRQADSSSSASKSGGATKTKAKPNPKDAAKAKDVAKANLSSELRSSTRARLDVFGGSNSLPSITVKELAGIKRKHTDSKEQTDVPSVASQPVESEPKKPAVSLVGYESE